jgi:hypothetical protein
VNPPFFAYGSTHERGVRNYFYNADFIVDLASELDVPVRINGQRWWTAEASS